MLIPPISGYMTLQPWTIRIDAKVSQARQLMREHQIRHLPVLEAGNRDDELEGSAPGTNKRRPRPRSADEQIVQHRPELRIVDAVLWAAVQERVQTVAKVYERGERQPGLLVCARCGSPMSIAGGSSAAYYRCQTNKTKGTCDNSVSVREDLARLKILGGIQDYMLSGEGAAKIRERLNDELANYRQRIETEISDRRFKIKVLEIKLHGLANAIADGEQEPKSIKATMHELEAAKGHEEAELDAFIKASYAPKWQLPAVKEIEALMTNLDRQLTENIELGRAMLRRWLNDGLIKIDETTDGEIVADIELMPGRIVIEVPVRSRNRKEKSPEVGSDLRANPMFLFGSGGMTSPRAGRLLIMFAFLIRRNGPTRYRSQRRLVTRTPKT